MGRLSVKTSSVHELLKFPTENNGYGTKLLKIHFYINNYE